MGYAAVVQCTCYRDGKTTEPPHKAYVHAAPDGLYLDLDGLSLDARTRQAWEDEFDEWRDRRACPHPDMTYVYEYLQTMSGMGTFRSTLARLDAAQRFPVLEAHLPRGSGGTFPAELAATVLQEIQLLEQEPTPESIVRLTEGASGQLVTSVAADERCVLHFSSHSPNYALDAGGFFLFLDKKRSFFAPRSQVVFRSTHFRQTRQGPDSFLFTDLATDHSYPGPVGLRLAEGQVSGLEHTFTVDIQPVLVGTQHAYILTALKRILAASLETGNPVLWR
ncbi:hypothetical protein [Hymenobacter cellulosilyticus]|uniref:Uncharacterized protein n=1 Tax=Hymenobacter cellulosilyticus TaxID=2932248 RepID=A0A8T9QAE9_9BACT|nr:hypothetical protein [Hymenobacter cellulosilyticus]UOQ74504.1 hypothetical protein MUN79_11845 [Hymenobacter cellulosilyticus]